MAKHTIEPRPIDGIGNDFLRISRSNVLKLKTIL